jgi:putative PEP-CTERM system TPR-repeat lipoprotein
MWVVGVCLALAACSADSETLKRRYLESGRQFVSEGKLAEAVIEFQKAIQQDERFGEARYELAETLRQTGDLAGAGREYIRAADLLPNDADVQLKAGNANLLAAQFEDARTRAQKALAIDPNNIEAYLLMGTALAGLKQLDAAVTEVEKAIELDPDRALTYTNLGSLRVAQGDMSSAREYFVRATSIDPKSVRARLALANFYWGSGQRDDAIRTLNEALAIDASDAMLRRLLAFFYMASNRPAEAEAHLKAVAEQSPDPNARAMLADFYRRARRFPEALQVLDTIGQDETTFALVNIRRALIQFDQGNRDQAHLLLERVLARNAGDIAALLARAQFYASERKLDEALQAAEAATKADRTIVPAHFVLARVQAARGNTEAAIAAYAEALKLNPALPAALIEMARLQLSSARALEALQAAQQAVALQPNSPEAVLTLARAQVVTGNVDAATRTLTTMAAVYAGSDVVHSQLGTLYAVTGDARSARRSYERALAIDEFNIEALNGLFALDLAANTPAAGRPRIEQRLAKRPNSAELLILGARTYQMLGDTGRSEQLLRRAVEAQPSNIQGFMLLGQLYVLQRRTDEAIAEFERIVSVRPTSVSAHTLVAMLLEASNRRDAARVRYEQVLSIDPRAPVAANNLAVLYAETGGNLDEALRLAQTAKAGLPDSPDVADTLGWIHYQRGSYAQAVAVLKESVSRQPNNAAFQYHLGMAHWKNGELRPARTALEAGLKLNPLAAEANEARTTLNLLTALGS